MLHKIYSLSYNVELYEELGSTDSNVENLLPFLRERVAFLESIRRQSFRCRILCLPNCKENRYTFIKKSMEGLIEIQYPCHRDARLLPRILCHELTHYITDNHSSILIPDLRTTLSTYEEIIAETFAMSSLQALLRMCRRIYGKDSEVLVSRYIEELSDKVHHQTTLILQKGLRAVPLYDNSFRPEYGNIHAIAFRLHPHFEEHPELWRILPYVQNVHPLADWNEFFGYLIRSVDEECRKALIDLYPGLEHEI